jgi:hypothetical protein
MRFRAFSGEPSVHTRKPSGLISPSGLLRLANHAAMGVAMGLAFALILILAGPSGITSLINHSGSQGIAVFVGTVVLTFGIGATLTGLVFIMTEDD